MTSAQLETQISVSLTRQRTERLQMHVEAGLTMPPAVLPPFAEIARQLRIIVADDVTDDEIIMAAYRVRAEWRYRVCTWAREGWDNAEFVSVIAGARVHLEAMEANCARWVVEASERSQTPCFRC
ncbi:MAG TPA: hypothetical protein VGP42_16530 [Stellaceae bacterium]|nr:hypothetical protein [Stellaceae bacterium]